MVAALQQTQAGAQNGAHAGGSGDTPLCLLHGRQSFFKHAHRGIGEPGVDIPRFVLGKPGRRLGRVLEYVTGR